LRILVRLREEQDILEATCKRIDLAGGPSKAAVWSSVLINETSMPSSAKKPLSCATKSGPKPGQVK
jgi:hypothetical protein